MAQIKKVKVHVKYIFLKDGFCPLGSSYHTEVCSSAHFLW